jgi:hypothetical protein
VTKIVIDKTPESADFGWIIEQISRMMPTVRVSQIPEE